MCILAKSLTLKNTNSVFIPNSVCLWNIVVFIRDTGVLIFLRVIFIYVDIVFAETIFPFASLHSNAGARLRH
jgi:hypothetical protein